MGVACLKSLILASQAFMRAVPCVISLQFSTANILVVNWPGKNAP